MVGERRRVSIAPSEARLLLDAYRDTASTLAEANAELDSLVREASALLGRPAPDPALGHIAQDLRSDADDLEDRLLFLERTDKFGVRLEARPTPCLASSCGESRAEREIWSIARDITQAESPEEIHALVDQLVIEEFFRHNTSPLGQAMPAELRPILATAFAIAIEQGLSADRIPSWFSAGIIEYGQPRPEVMAELAYELLVEWDPLSTRESPNPFGLSRHDGVFGAVVRTVIRQPAVARALIEQLLLDHDQFGDTVLNRHGDGLLSEQLAEIVLAASTGGNIEDRTVFVDRLVKTINADGNTNSPVFWATWTAHAELAIEHDIRTTSPAFGVHRLVPDPIRPYWEAAWTDYVSPATLQVLSGLVFVGRQTPQRIATAISAQLSGAKPTPDAGPGNDPGGSFTTRPISEFPGTRWGANIAQGRRIISHALEEASPGSVIARDEFAIIDHGLGANDMATYTIVLPGVIDLSNPFPGFDPVHASVRDLDQVAIHSADNALVEHNQYAQMVIRALALQQIPPGANLLIVGHSFGADTALDLAADTSFTETYNVSHVVAAAYDSVPQLAAVSPEIDVLVLQNEDDQVIVLEAAHRAVAQSDESVSMNTFAHDVREFPGGAGLDVGHHPDRYIAYVENTSDTELDAFLESVAAIGYGEPGTSVAVDVSIETE